MDCHTQGQRVVSVIVDIRLVAYIYVCMLVLKVDSTNKSVKINLLVSMSHISEMQPEHQFHSPFCRRALPF